MLPELFPGYVWEEGNCRQHQPIRQNHNVRNSTRKMTLLFQEMNGQQGEVERITRKREPRDIPKNAVLDPLFGSQFRQAN